MATFVRFVAALVPVLALSSAPAQARQPAAVRPAQLEPVRPTSLQVQLGGRPAAQSVPLRPLSLPPPKPEASPTTFPDFSNPLKRRRMALPAPDANPGY
jgi:hypothetical protein